MTQLLSVIIPCYNDGAFLEEALASVFGQDSHADVTLPDIEVLVVDDRSNDPATVTILKEVPRRWPKVKIVKNERKQGVSGARNFGIAACRGEWVAFLDADDIWLPDALVQRWRVLSTQPTAAWIAGDYQVWHADGSLTARDPGGKTHVSRVLRITGTQEQPLKLVQPVSEFIGACLVLPSAVMVKKDVLDRVGGFDETLSPAEDYEMWLRLARVTDLHFVSHCVFHYRQRTGSLSNKAGPPAAMEIRVFSRLLADPKLQPFRRQIREKLASLSLANAYYHQHRSEWRLGVAAAGDMVRWQPVAMASWKHLAGALVAGFKRLGP